MVKRKLKKKITKILLLKIIPLWMVVVLVLQGSLVVGLVEYYFMKKNFDTLILSLAERTKSPEELILILKQQVLPQKGHLLSVTWEDVGKKLVQSGAIDKAKYLELFSEDEVSKNHIKYLENSSNDYMRIDEQNSRFMENTLWRLGLVNKNSILELGDRM